MNKVAWIGILGLSAVFAVSAQEESHMSAMVGGGFTEGVGRTGMYTDTGWNVRMGFGYNFNSYVGAMVDVSENMIPVNSSTLRMVGAQGGDVNIFSATLDPIVHVNPHGRADVYVTGGGGEYRRSQAFGPALPYGVYNATPFLLNDSTNHPGDHYSVNKPGVDAGVGVAFGSRWHGRFFAEAKYNHIFLNGYRHTDFVPVTFGYRW